MPQIVRYEDGMKLTINDYMDLVVKMPQITQLFSRAVVQFAASFVIGAITQIHVTIGEELNRLDYIQHEQKVCLNIAKLSTTTRHYAQAYMEAEQKNYPPKMKKELADALMRQFVAEMQDLAPGK